MNDQIKAAILLLVEAGYTVSKNVSAAPTAPFGFKLDGTPKKSPAGRPPGTHNRAATPAPVPTPTPAPMMVDFLDLDFGAAPAPKATPPKAAAPAPKAAPAKPATPAPAAAPPVARKAAAEDDILSDLDSLLG